MLKKTVIVKLFIDITMIIVYSLLMFARSLGGFFHETVGLGMGILFLAHILLNRPLLTGLFKSVKNRQPKKTVLVASDIALTLCMPTVIVTGILIAKELFVMQPNIPWMLLFNIHYVLSYVCLGIMILHILLHAKYLLGVLKKLPSSLAKKEAMPAVFCFSAGLIAAVMLYFLLAVHKSKPDDQTAPEIPHPIVAENTIPAAPASSPEHQAESTATVIDEVLETNDTDSTTAPERPTSIVAKNTIPSVPASNSDRRDESTAAVIDEVSETNDADSTAAPAENTDTERSIATDDTAAPHPTLEEYLSQLRCTGCGRRCILLNPRCRTGEAQASRAEAEYNRLYSDNK